MNHTLLNNQERARQLRIRIENITILLLAVFSFFLFLLTFFPFSRISKAMQGSFEMAHGSACLFHCSFRIVPAVMEEKTERMDNRRGDLCPQFSARTHRNGTSAAQRDHDSRPFLIYPVFHHAVPSRI